MDSTSGPVGPSSLHVVVTGGSSGIGRATVQSLLAHGHRVFATGRDPEALEKLQTEMEKLHGQDVLRTSIGEVGKEQDVSIHVKEALEFFSNRLDVAVLNAGCGAGRKRLEDVPLETFDNVFNTNVRGVFLWMTALLPVMRPQRRGQIVVTSSAGAMRPCLNQAVYAASKSAVQVLVASVREELRGTGVKVGTVNPGAVATEWWEEEGRGGYDWSAGSELEKKEKLAFWRSMLTPEAVAGAVLSLVEQPASSNIHSLIMDPSDFDGVPPPEKGSAAI